jgi:hypothetical protein
MKDITNIVEAVKAIRSFAKTISESDVTKEDMESLATLSPTLKEGLDNMNEWMNGGDK